MLCDNVEIISASKRGEKERIYPMYFRFFLYQNERLPVIVLGILVALVVLSISEILFFISGQRARFLHIIVAFLTVFFYIAHVRLFDEFKDFEHDRKYYPTRPISRGLLKISELRVVITLLVLLEVALNFFTSIVALFTFTFSLLYSFFSAKDYFFTQRMKERF